MSRGKGKPLSHIYNGFTLVKKSLSKRAENVEEAVAS